MYEGLTGIYPIHCRQIAVCLPILFVLTVVASIAVSCSGSQSKYNDIIDYAESISLENPDSASALLDVIDPMEINVRAQRDLWGEKISWGEDLNMAANRRASGTKMNSTCALICACHISQ